MIVERVSRTELFIKAPAKINLYLRVLSKRADGFHNISSLFQTVSLFDELRFELTDTPGIRIDLVTDTDLPLGPDNLIARSYELMKRRFDLKVGLQVRLEKCIPVGAGLGGGSSDAAATIEAVNALCNIGLDRPKKAELGLELGSDIPFFFGPGQAVVGGRGEIVEDVQLPVDYWIALLSPSESVSTAEAYEALKIDLTEDRKPVNFRRCRTTEELFGFLAEFGNDFEEFYLYSLEKHRKIPDDLLRLGASVARLSGTGSTFFGIFEKDPEDILKQTSLGEGVGLKIVRPLGHGVE